MIELVFSSSRNAEVANTSKTVVDAFNKFDWTTQTFIHHQLEVLAGENKHLSDAIERTTIKSELSEKDRKKGKQYRSIYKIVEANQGHMDEDVQIASQALFKVFSKYGLRMTHESYRVESAHMDSLLDDLATPEMQGHIAKIEGLADMIISLKALQQEFQSYFVYYEEQKAKEKVSGNATQYKKKVLKILNGGIITFLRSMEVSEEPSYKEIIPIVSQIVADNNEQVRRRTNKTPEPVKPDVN